MSLHYDASQTEGSGWWRDDPVISVYGPDGLMVQMTLLEWIGRAIVTHNMPPSTLDELQVFLDDDQVRKSRDES